MHPQLTLIAAQQHIADLHRAADHSRLVHAATSSHAGPAPRHATAAPVSLLRWLRDRKPRWRAPAPATSSRPRSSRR